MDRLGVILGVVLLLLSTILAEAHNDVRGVDGYSKRKANSVWFGPRLGRRKRNPMSEDNARSPALERDQIEALMEIIQDSPWAIVAINEGKRPAVNFTPRLGRESGEDLVSSGSPSLGSDRWLQDSELAGELMSQRSPPFAPRLGRRALPFSPRLGRNSDVS